MLGTPPAFVLSQDQTLEKFFRKLISSILNTNVFVKFAKTFLELTRHYTLCNCRNTVLFVLHITAFLTVYFSNISSQLAFLLAHFRDPRLFRRLLLFPKNFDSVSFFVTSAFWAPVFAGPFFCSPQERAYLSYHTLKPLSTLFFELFSFFFVHKALLGATRLYYHTYSPLSSTFLSF